MWEVQHRSSVGVRRTGLRARMWRHPGSRAWWGLLALLVVVMLGGAGLGGVGLVREGRVLGRGAGRRAVVADRGLGVAGGGGAQGDQGGSGEQGGGGGDPAGDGVHVNLLV